MTKRNEQESFNDVRRAALVLRERDPSEAVRILRQVVRRADEAAPLAHGALGEILLDDFDDLDGAAHHFRELLKLVPGLPVAEIGLARALSRQGLAVEAEAAQRRAIEGLATVIRKGISGEEEAPEALDETLLTLLEVAVERRDLAADAGLELAPEPPLDDCFTWAETNRLFDDPDEPESKDDWARYADLRAVLLGFTGRRDELDSFLTRIAGLGELPVPAIEHARSLALEAMGNLAGAAQSARLVLGGGTLDAASPAVVLRASDLERALGEEQGARALLEQYKASVAKWPSDEAQPILSEIEARLRSTSNAPSLVRLGTRRRTE